MWATVMSSELMNEQWLHLSGVEFSNLSKIHSRKDLDGFTEFICNKDSCFVFTESESGWPFPNISLGKDFRFFLFLVVPVFNNVPGAIEVSETNKDVTVIVDFDITASPSIHIMSMIGWDNLLAVDFFEREGSFVPFENCK